MHASLGAIRDETSRPTDPLVHARLLVVDGVVQGVGFRPFVYRMATALKLSGFVRNEGARVVIAVAGELESLDRLQHALLRDVPPRSRVDQLVTRTIGVDEIPGPGFAIVDSVAAARESGTAARLTSDTGICEQCERELLDPSNRRHRHAFISCTDCGPRWSMVEALPYDRVRTSMQGFGLCHECHREYTTPSDRRYHAESICCPQCGPVLSAFTSLGHARGERADAIAEAVRVLRAGGVIALHGIGGFHLAVDATNARAVQVLRERKHRPAKAFAVMVRTARDARALVNLDSESEALLRAAERPVVIAPVHEGIPVAANVAPGLVELGVMLPSTAIQHLLLYDFGGPLVMTSGNASGEPLAATVDDAWQDLAGIADLLLMHDRPVVAPSDDTVFRREAGGAIMLRRARGWSPERLALPVPAVVPILALGAELKTTVCLGNGGYAWLSAHLGDQRSFGVQQRTADAVRRLVKLSGVVPQIVACDAHPGYASSAMLSRWAADEGDDSLGFANQCTVQQVQHHHAHVAAVMLEHGITHPVVALAFDGAGWGLDGTMWGGEVLVADLTTVKRVGALLDAPLIGGDLAAQEPWRAALGWLLNHDGVAFRAVTDALSPLAVDVACRLALRPGTFRTSSMGRLFDAAAAVLHVVPRNSYEGEAAARLEALAAKEPHGIGVAFECVHAQNGGPWRLDPRGALERLAVYRALGMRPERLAARWHDDVAATAVAAALRAVDDHAPVDRPIQDVVLCGGVFQNVRLLHAVRTALESRGLTVLTARTLPPNDGAIAVGQMAIAAATLSLAGRNT